MRIFGGHDYYDVGLSLGIDTTITLVRSRNATIDLSALKIAFPSVNVTCYEDKLLVTSMTVVFCNTVYRGIKITDNKNKLLFWDYDKFMDWKNQNKIKVRLAMVWEFPNFTFKDYFRPLSVASNLRELMIRKKISILIEDETNSDLKGSVKVNPWGLKEMGFAKALDPYQAFQELSMWIGGVLGGTSPEIVTIKDDIVLAESHGFDKVTSFRGPRIK
jgi:hypothetical protein